MDIALLLLFIVLLYTLQSFFTKLYSDKYPGESGMSSQIFTAVSGLAVAVVTFFIFTGCQFTFNPWCMLIAAVNALALFLYNFSLVRSSQTGPYSILMMFSVAGGILIPILFALALGWDCWNTPFKIVLNVLCIALIFASVYCVSRKDEQGSSEPTRGISVKFIIYCIGLAVGNGIYGVILTLQQKIEVAGGEANRDEMIIMTYLFACIISVVSGFIKKRGEYVKAFRQTKASLIFLVGASLIVALTVNLVVIIIPRIPSTLYYTLSNTLVLAFSTVCSAVFLKEKLSRLNIIGVCGMCLALIAMNLLPAIVPAGWVA